MKCWESHLNHGLDEERGDEGEDDAGDELEEAVEPDVDLVQVNIGHLK